MSAVMTQFLIFTPYLHPIGYRTVNWVTTDDAHVHFRHNLTRRDKL